MIKLHAADRDHVCRRTPNLDSKIAASPQDQDNSAGDIASIVEGLAAVCGRGNAEGVLLPKEGLDGGAERGLHYLQAEHQRRH